MKRTELKTPQQMRYILARLIEISLTPRYHGTGGAVACQWMIREIATLGPDRMVSKFLHEHQEYRLNGAGLKIYTRGSAEGVYFARVSGDQAKDYPQFVEEANRYLEEIGLQTD